MASAGALNELQAGTFGLLQTATLCSTFLATTTQARACMIVRRLSKRTVLRADDGELGLGAFVQAARVVIRATMYRLRSPYEFQCCLIAHVKPCEGTGESKDELRHHHQAFRFQPAFFLARRKQPQGFIIQPKSFLECHPGFHACLKPSVALLSHLSRRHVIWFHKARGACDESAGAWRR